MWKFPQFTTAPFDVFFGIDLRALVVLRISLATLVLIDLVARARDLTAHYTDAGVLTKAELLASPLGQLTLSLHTLSGEWWYQAALLWVTAGAALLLLIGYHTRIASIATWFLVLSMHGGNPLVLQGGDTELLMLLFFGMFLPWGRLYSVDVARTCKPPQKKTHVVSLATAGLLLQVAVIYASAFFHKHTPEWRSDLSAVYYAFSMDQYATDVARFLVQFDWLTALLTLTVVVLQLLSLPLIFSPIYTQTLRFTAFLLLGATHVAYFFTLHIGLFVWISLAGLVVLIPPFVWDRVFGSLKSDERRNLALYYQGTCGFCRRSVHLIRTFFLIPETKIAPAHVDPSIQRDMDKYDSWIVVDHTGARHVTFDAGVTIARHSPLLWPLVYVAHIPGMHRVGEWTYRFVARHRSHIPLPKEPRVHPPELGKLGHVISSCILVFVCFISFISLLESLDRVSYQGPLSVFSVPIWLLGTHQNWGVFAPVPKPEDGWYVLEATYASGAVRDLATHAPPTYSKPQDVASTFINQRWRKYLFGLHSPYYREYRPGYARWLCNKGRDASPNDPITRVDIIYLLELTTPEGELPPEKVNLISYSCTEQRVLRWSK